VNEALQGALLDDDEGRINSSGVWQQHTCVYKHNPNQYI
jgi:hypothetical protein